MLVFYVETKEGRKYIKDIDYAQGTIKYTTDYSEAQEQRGGYYTTPTMDMLKRNFKKECPEIETINYEYV